MANYTENFGSKLDWAMPFSRTGAYPLDRASMFGSYADAVKYAKGDTSDPDERGLCGTSYIGQVISVFEDDNAHLYIINADRTLGEVGAAALGDSKSIVATTDADGKQIFAIKGLDAAKEGQQLKIVNKGTTAAPQLEVEWFTPDNSTVEGLASNIETLQGAVDTVQADVNTITTTIGTPSEGSTAATGIMADLEDLDTNKADKATTLAGYGITDAYTKTEVDGKLTGALHYKGTSASFSALTATVTDGSYVPSIGDTWNITAAGGTGADGTAVKAGDNVIYNGTGWDVSAGTMDLSAYATTESVQTGLDAKVDKVTGSRLMTEEEAAKLAGLSDGASKVTASTTNGAISVDGEDVTVYTLPTATDKLGGIVTGSAGNANEVVVDATTGKATVPTVASSSVSGAVDAAMKLALEGGTKVEAKDILSGTTGVVKEAAKVSNKLTVGSKTFDGSAAVSITSDDIPLPSDVVKQTSYGTETTGGTVKSSTLQDNVTINATGTMTVNDISASKVQGSVASASKVDHTLTAGAKTFDGSANVEITAADLGALTDADIGGMITETDIATTDEVGVVKSSTAQDNVTVGTTGVMTVNDISASKVQGTVSSASDVTASINGNAITTIFEADGTTVKEATSAGKLDAAKNITISGDGSGATTFDGSKDADIALTLKASGVTAGTYPKVTVDAKGIVTAGATLTAADIPDITSAKVTDLGALATKDKVARTDIDTNLEADIATLETASHTHANKTVLDGITSTKVSAWDSVADDFANKADKATTLAGYGITDAYTKTEVNGMVAGAFHYKGSAATLAEIQETITAGTYTPSVGDTWNITTAGEADSSGVIIKAGDNVTWHDNGTTDVGWDVLSGTVDLSGYMTSTQINSALALKANKADTDAVATRVDTLESTIGDGSSGLAKDVASLKTATAANSADIATINTTIGDETSGLTKDIADNTAAITKLNGEASVDGSVKNLIAASASDISAAINDVTKTGGTIDTKIDTHNTAADAHADLFAAKQNQLINTTLTLSPTDFVANTETGAGEYVFVANKTISSLVATKSYFATVTPLKSSETVILNAHFSAEVSVDGNIISFYAKNKPVDTIDLAVTFAEI